MTNRTWFSFLSVVTALAAGLACDRVAVTPMSSPFRVDGAHVPVTCEACHPDDPATVWIIGCGVERAWDGGCLGCHSCDRDALHPAGPSHGQGLSCAADAGCHSTLDSGWDALGDGVTGGTVTQLGPCAGACHGNARPDDAPLDDSHAAHLDGSGLWVADGTCSGCHPEGDAGASTHADGVVDLPFSGRAVDPAQTLSPSYGDDGTCTVYCHGVTLPEGGALPVWEGGSAEAACGTCHGWPPTNPHPTDEACSRCHLAGGDEQQIAEAIWHIDGSVD